MTHRTPLNIASERETLQVGGGAIVGCGQGMTSQSLDRRTPVPFRFEARRSVRRVGH